jgi:hypothetical protein
MINNFPIFYLTINTVWNEILLQRLTKLLFGSLNRSNGKVEETSPHPPFPVSARGVIFFAISLIIPIIGVLFF